MRRFSTRIALAMYGLALFVSLVLGGILISSSLRMMREHVIHTGRTYARLIATESQQKRDMGRRMFERILKDSGDTLMPSPDELRKMILGEENRAGVDPEVLRERESILDTIQKDLYELASVLDAQQIAFVFEDRVVVKAVTVATGDDVLDEAAILAMWHRFPKEGSDFYEEIVGSTVAFATRLEGEGSGQGLVLQLPTAGFRELIAQHAVLLLLAVGIVLVGALVVASVLSRSISLPLSRLNKVAVAYGHGQLDVKAPVAGPEETSTLGRAFNQMALSLEEHIQTLEQETRKREQLETEFRIAAQLQRSLLPEPGLYKQGPVQLLGWNEQAQEVGGDFYDYWPVGDDKLAIVIGDATGKGMTAALLAAKCLSVMQTLTSAHETPDKVLAEVNQFMCRQLKREGLFITAVLVLIDLESGQASCSFAGHNPAWLCSPAAGALPEKIASKQGLPLGVSSEVDFELITLKAMPGDTLVLYTDGVTEAFDPEGKLYGDMRLNETCRQCAALPVEEILRRLQEDLADHRSGEKPSDDATFVLVRL